MLWRMLGLRLMPSGLVARYIALLVLLGLLATHLTRHSTLLAPQSRLSHPGQAKSPSDQHEATSSRLEIALGGVQSPIRDLMINASTHFDGLIAERTEDMWAASSRYRIRRGRHPPPGFEQWVNGARDSNAVIVEQFFDRIYKDITPFWGLDPKVLREQAKGWGTVISIRKGKTSIRGRIDAHPRWLRDWADLISEFSQHMPDLDIPLNSADEPRLLVPFDKINKLVLEEAGKRHLVPLKNVKERYMGLASLDDQKIAPHEPAWVSPEQNLWDMAARTCDPGSPSFGVAQIADLTAPMKPPSDWKPEYAFKGFVQNWTAATDLCEQPHVRHLHGAFSHPGSVPVTEELIPVFSGYKLSRNNDIVMPGAVYLGRDDLLQDVKGLRHSWARKSGKVYWRGDADRLVKMLDGGLITRLEASEEDTTIDLPQKGLYSSERRDGRRLGSWLSGIADASPDISDAPSFTSQVANRFLPDVDMSTPNTRFRALLLSTSLPLKSTLFTEWHDDRLIPWVHFVPLDLTLQDLHATLEFFAGGSGTGDEAARFIAERGAEWADKALRREDMKLYLWRLLLEWARVRDDRRDELSYTNDVREHPD
ncbi:glycosyl transferase family 90 domain-containing protein [Sarocladium implicatum]|nr:glycosyl transferase family 90 domain-containing protein [Sarocladium implicatum]